MRRRVCRSKSGEYNQSMKRLRVNKITLKDLNRKWTESEVQLRQLPLPVDGRHLKGKTEAGRLV
jgi:hypothetical protein